MTDYISREAAIEETRKPRLTDAELRRRLAELPAADVAPVVHGQWMTKEYEYGDPEAGISDMWVDRPAEPSDDYAFCPVCGNDAGYTGEGCLILSDYCPNCGARMDEE